MLVYTYFFLILLNSLCVCVFAQSSIKLEDNLNISTVSSFRDKIIDNYYQLFTVPEGADILPYAYIQSGEAYDLMIQHCADYYLFNNEANIIKNSAAKLKEHLYDIINIIEIGPGSQHALTHKTIPLLSCANSLKNYYAIDSSKYYLDNICIFLKQNIHNLEIMGLENDIMNLNNIHFLKQQLEKKCILFLVSTLGNFSQEQQTQLLQQTFQLMQCGDKFVLGVDTNQDEKSLTRAYNNNYLYTLIEGALQYFCTINPIFENYIDFFESKCVWNQNSHTIEMYFIARENMIFSTENYDKIAIGKGQKFRAAISKKFILSEINSLLDLFRN